MWTEHVIACVLHHLNALWREYDGILASEDNMILSRVVLVFADPRLLERLERLLPVLLDHLDPLGWGEGQ